MRNDMRLKIAVVGTGISGLSAAWLLSPRHEVTVYERADRVGGHSNTVSARVDGASLTQVRGRREMLPNNGIGAAQGASQNSVQGRRN